MKSNALRLYKHFCEMVENPKGMDTAERANVRSNAIKSKAELEEHFKTSKKYKNDSEIQALINPKQEIKEDGKKSKG